MQRDVGRRLLQRLHVGVDREELDALDLGLDHAIDRVHAPAAHAHDADPRLSGGLVVLEPACVLEFLTRRSALLPFHDVVGDLRGEGVAQPLLRRGHVRLLHNLVVQRGMRAPLRALRGACGRRVGRRIFRALRVALELLGLGFELLRLAKERRERAFPHACALSVCHARAPPGQAGGRTGRLPRRAHT